MGSLLSCAMERRCGDVVGPAGGGGHGVEQPLGTLVRGCSLVSASAASQLLPPEPQTR